MYNQAEQQKKKTTTQELFGLIGVSVVKENKVQNQKKRNMKTQNNKLI